ncbi:MAG: phosphotransferase [Chloroflexota bacterium]
MPNLTELIAIGRTAEVFAWQEDQVLKLFYEWVPDDWITHEFRIASLIQSTGMDVPAVVGDIVEVEGRRGICYQRVNGNSMLQVMESHPLSLFEQAGLLGKLHAEMHCRQGIGLPSQRKKLRFKIKDADPLPDHLKDAVLQILAKLPDGDQICHGDFHPGNILMTSRGPIVIDWTDASSGNPLSDVARTLVLLTTAQLPLNSFFGWLVKFRRKHILDAYSQSYFTTLQLDRSQLQSWMIIVAAARLNEKIPGENEHLIKIVRRGLN